MKIKLLVFALLPLMAFTTIADWVKVNVDEKATVEFPVEPTKQGAEGTEVWMAKIDSNSSVLVLRLDFSGFGMDSAMVASNLGNPEFVNGFRNGIIGKMPNATLASEKQYQLNGSTVIDYVINQPASDGTSAAKVIHNRNFFVGSVLYSLSIEQTQGKEQSGNRDKFFNSFKVK